MDGEGEEQVAAETYGRPAAQWTPGPRNLREKVPVLGQHQHREQEDEIVDEVASCEARKNQQEHKSIAAPSATRRDPIVATSTRYRPWSNAGECRQCLNRHKVQA